MIDLKSTLCIFETSMPIRANNTLLDNEIYTYWEAQSLSSEIYKIKKNAPLYVLHDGPPYANGPIHLGHAYNKVMKDICIRSHMMMGYNSYTIPGWDCHGLPIEHKVTQECKDTDPVTIKNKCRAYAEEWIKKQKESFKKLGVLMDWNNPYKTMSFDYQSSIIKIFGQLFHDEYISRSNKTVPWCCGCQTALASAEIEYKNVKDPSLYVLFKAKQTSNILKNFEKESIYFIIWTTTPWTLPLNRGIMLKKNGTYIIVKFDNKFFIIGKNCFDHFSSITKTEYTIVEECNSEELKNEQAFHPFEENIFVPIILEDSVETNEGTACVHTAPGCGPIDYEIGIKNNLEIYSPISNDGKYTDQVKIKELIGISITDGQTWIIKELHSRKLLLFKTTINHSYPHCWRSLEKLIFRATPQWFCNLEKNNFKQRALEAIEKIDFYPLSGKSTLKATVSNRWEWCISRQRNWGVPIVALIHKENSLYWTSVDFINFIAKEIETYGIEYWDKVDLSTKTFQVLIPKEIFENINSWRKEKDILDVWFDSGISHTHVLKKQNTFPADIYLEGVDQHRGWFQSSLLTSVALYNQAPMKTIISCGYTVDEKGQKMSKSLGNGVDPEDIIKKIGLDGLRAWIASVHLGGDIVVSDKVFSNIQEICRKIRNTCRFAVQNIVDFDPDIDMISFHSMNFINQYTLKKLYEYNIKIIAAYQNFDFSEVFNLLIDLCNSFLSAFYFDTHKDILYCEKNNSLKRKETQSVLYVIVDMITKLIAPICVNTAEDISNHYKSKKNKSIHCEEFSKFKILKTCHENGYDLHAELLLKKDIIQSKITTLKNNQNNEYFILWKNLFSLREIIFKKIEEARENNTIKQSIEAKITIFYNKESIIEKIIQLLPFYSHEKVNDFFQLFFIVSKIIIEPTNTIDSFIVKKYEGQKCQRCWRYFDKITEITKICHRCEDVIQEYLK